MCEIRQGWRALKGTLIATVHPLDRRIKAHIFICVLALQIRQLMRNRLSKSSLDERASTGYARIKFEIQSRGDTATLLATEVTAEQKGDPGGRSPAPHCFSMKM